MNIEVIKVTPEQAAKWLDSNTENNRKLKRRIINQYARDMMKGNWKMTGEAIKFDRDGKLIDGQHRLTAIVLSKQTIEITVITGLDSAVLQVIDTGRSRTAADALTVSGKGENANAVAALARKIMGYHSGGDVLNARKITIKGEPIANHEILDFCNKNDLGTHIRFAARMSQQQITHIYPNGDWAFLHWLLSQKNTEHAELFLTKLATLENIPLSGNPIRALFEKITKATALTPKQRLQATILAWNAYRTGKSMSVIKVGRLDADEVLVAI